MPGISSGSRSSRLSCSSAPVRPWKMSPFPFLKTPPGTPWLSGKWVRSLYSFPFRRSVPMQVFSITFRNDLQRKVVSIGYMERIHCKKRLAIFPSPAGVSITKLSLGGKFFTVLGAKSFLFYEELFPMFKHTLQTISYFCFPNRDFANPHF